jgi:hypothetical protein
MNLLEAWSLWLSGDLSSNAVLLGISILWWGRLGKLMEFVGGATIIADIIGPEKIRRFGTSLHNAITPMLLMEFLRNSFQWYVVIFRHSLMKDYADETTAKRIASAEEELHHSKLSNLNYLICFVLTVIIVSSVELHPSPWIFLVEATIIFFCLLVSISPTLTVVTIISITMAGLLFNSIVIKPLAWVLEHPALDRFTKFASLLLLLGGFHFELLSS